MTERRKSNKIPRDAERRTRTCLMCRTEFDSSWAGERICRKCKSSAAYRSG